MTDVQLLPALVIWADFACPWSALISARSDSLRERGLVEVDWRAVQLRPDLPPQGTAPEAAWMASFDEAVQAATPGERQHLRAPGRQPNTAEPTRRLAALDPWARPAARSRLFQALWHDDLDIGSPAVLELIQLPGVPGDPVQAEATARRWQSEWEALGDRVPALMDGHGQVRLGGPDCLDLLDKLF